MSVGLNQRLQGSSNSKRLMEQEPAMTESNPNMMQLAASSSQGGLMQQPDYYTVVGDNSQMTALQDDFTLLDVIGGASLSVLHPTKPIVAYTSGCIIIVFDLMSDTKIQLTSHEHEVHALAFTPAGAGGRPGQGGDYLISVDFNRNEPNEENGPLARLFIWDWRQGQCIQQVRIPSSMAPGMLGGHQMPSVSDLRSNKPLRLFQIVFDKSGSTFLVLESSTSEVGGGYRVSVWNFNRANAVGLVSHDDLDLQQTCLSICMLQNASKPTTLANPMYNQPTGQVSQLIVAHGDANSQLAQIYLTNTVQFLTVERSCVKIWEMNQGAFELKKRIHIKQEIKQCVVSELTGFMLILGANGKVLILDAQGEFVSTVSRQGTFFTHIGTCDDRLLLGTERGTVHAYHIASLMFINEIPYQIALLPNSCLNQDPLHATQQAKASRPLNKIEEALLKVGPPVSGISATKDKRFLMLSYIDSSFAVIDRQVVTSLSDAILGYQFGHFEAITGLQWMGGNKSRIGGPVLSDQYQLIHQSNECFATCSSDLSVYIWRHFGDRWQTQYIDVTKCFMKSLSYQRKNCDKSTASLKLTALQVMPRRQTLAIADNRGTVRVFELGADEATLVSTHQLMRSPELLGDQTTAVKQVHFTNDEQVAVVTYDTGLVSAYDVRGGFTWLGDIEKEVPRLGQTSTSTLSKVLERDDMRDDPNGGYLINHFKPVNQQETKFSVFSLRGPNCIKQQLVEVKDNRLGVTTLTQFFIDAGKISGFDIHPSKDYILITSTKGKIYVFRIDTGELRGTIDVPLHAQDCLIDPSGLYVVVKVPPFSPRHTSNLTNKNEEFANMGLNEKDLSRTTILMYEVGTRRVAAEVHSIFDISTMKFSSDGRYLSLGSHKGAVSIWALGDHLFRAVHEVIERMKARQDFWCNYPIYLPDHSSQGQSQQQAQQVPYGTESRTSMAFTPQYQAFGQDELLNQKRNIDAQLEQIQKQTQPFAPQSEFNIQQYQQSPQQQVYDQAGDYQQPGSNPPPRQPASTYSEQQTPLRQRNQQPSSYQAQSYNDTQKASYADQGQHAHRLNEVEANSQDLQPSNFASAQENTGRQAQPEYQADPYGAQDRYAHQNQQHHQQQQQHPQQPQVNQSEIAKPSSQADETQSHSQVIQPSLIDENANAQRFLREGGSDVISPAELDQEPVRAQNEHPTEHSSSNAIGQDRVSHNRLRRAESRSALDNHSKQDASFSQHNDEAGRVTERQEQQAKSINDLLPGQRPADYEGHAQYHNGQESNHQNAAPIPPYQTALPPQKEQFTHYQTAEMQQLQDQMTGMTTEPQQPLSQRPIMPQSHAQLQQPSERLNYHQSQGPASMDQLYRRQSPHTRPIRGDHEYSQYLSQKQKMFGGQLPPQTHGQHMNAHQALGQSAGVAAQGIEIMPSAHEVMLAQSMQQNYRPGLDGYGFDQTRYNQAQTHFSQSAGQKNLEPLYPQVQQPQQQQMPSAATPDFYPPQNLESRSRDFFGTGRQQEPLDIDAGVRSRSPYNQPSMSQHYSQRPLPQMLYTDTGVIIPEHSQYELPAPTQNHISTRPTPIPAQIHRPHQAMPSFGGGYGSGSSYQTSFQSPQFARPAADKGFDSRPPVETAYERASRITVTQTPQLGPGGEGGTSSRAAQDVARAYHEVDEFEARMRNQERPSASQLIPVDSHTMSSSAPPQSYAKDLIGRSFRAQ